MNPSRIVPAALALLLATALAPTVGAAESPRDGTCDASGRLVCAGLDVGGDAGCSVDAAGHAECWYTYGWLTTAFSPLGLPGDETHVVTAVVSVCIDGDCSEDVREHEGDPCAWVGPVSCDDAGGPNPGAASVDLALGECVTLRVDLAGVIHARTGLGANDVARVQFENEGMAAASACHLDNGRP